MKTPQLFGISALAASVALAGCSTIASTITHINENPINISVIDGKLPSITATQSKTAKPLQFDVNHYKPLDVTVDNQTIKVRAYENIVYVANPVDTAYQSMNIYIPESYFEDKSINGYTASTAPIFMPNAVGGYMPAKPMTVGTGRDGKPNSVAQALHRGMIVASAGARGRTLKSEQGEYYGKAPAAIVDLKAAVRYLKANDGVMAGDAGKIIVNGTSAGGAMTALLGATGDSADYEPYLQKLGAAKASDSVFAVSSYCPITNLEHADMAYEWQLADVVDYKKMSVTMLDYNVKRELVPGRLTDKEKQIAQLLKADFPSYINGLKLKGRDGKLLSLDKDGSGSFKNEVLYYLNKSVNTAHKQGVDLSSYTFLAQKNQPSRIISPIIVSF
ncbi:subtype B tannase [uncultured Moraxella sp.]|uniref:subtype B tannase n=1 Tax=uncultured Moraxella sp. TaxID=263769 RepID=UPI0025D0A4E4|nr:subtype B tannase [uncultured Moraxella sp.]